MGESVSATIDETMTAPTSVKANSVKSAPVSPPRNPIGTYTATSTMAIAMMGLANSRAARIAACVGFMPSSRWRLTFSTTMMASSTTRPMPSTRASSVSRLIE